MSTPTDLDSPMTFRDFRNILVTMVCCGTFSFFKGLIIAAFVIGLWSLMEAILDAIGDSIDDWFTNKEPEVTDSTPKKEWKFFKSNQDWIDSIK